MLSFFPQDVLDEIWDLIGSVSEGFVPTLLSRDTRILRKRTKSIANSNGFYISKVMHL